MAPSARAIANSDVVFLAWRYDEKIDQCLGFRIERKKDGAKKWEPLPAWVGWEGDKNAGWVAKDTAVWPVQKFTWRDFYVDHETTYVYRITPMIGPSTNLTPDTAHAVVTQPVTVTSKHGDIGVCFNRGIVSTQSLTRSVPKAAKGGPDHAVLQKRIDQPGDPLRNRLAVDILPTLTGFLDQPGQFHAALYELDDVELLKSLLGLKERLHIILSNTGPDDSRNAPARQTLHDAGIDITDRMLANDANQIGHNKFVVHVDEAGTPQAVITGSTNWSDTGLCTQVNNVIRINSGEVAAKYLDYWKRLKSDDAQQAPKLRDFDRAGQASDVVSGTELKIWFSPNTKATKKPTTPKEVPVDLAQVSSIISGAQQAILFLIFQPGSPSVLEMIAAAKDKNPKLFVHGAISDENTVEMYHRNAEISETYAVGVGGIPDEFGYWEQEMYRFSNAVIHDKVVVVDPFSAQPTVITGSHNLGYKASYSNDENMVIARGNPSIAAAYATHIMDVYDHYRWRYRLTQQAKEGKLDQAWQGLKKSAAWQANYFGATSHAREEIVFWNPDAAAPEAVKTKKKTTKPVVTTGPKLHV